MFFTETEKEKYSPIYKKTTFSKKADVILGPIGIVIADSMLGEVTEMKCI